MKTMKTEQDANKKSFDKIEYIKAFNKSNYNRITAVFTKEEAARVEAAANKLNVSKSAFIKSCVLDTINKNKEYHDVNL